MIARAVEAIFYHSAVRGTHRALSEMGFIPAEAGGTPAEQVRAIVAPEAIGDKPADDEKVEAEDKADGQAPRRKRGNG